MAKVHIDRIIAKYNIKPDPIKGYAGKLYRELINHIIAQNTDNMNKNIVKMNRDGWNKALSKITPKEKKFILPDISDVLPKRAIEIRKAATRGQLVSNTLRDTLTKNLRESLNQFTDITGEATYIRRRGAKAGTINPKLIKDFEDRITTTFTNYTKRKKGELYPANIKAIATTEMRSAINEMKSIYVNKLREKNPDLIFKKVWIHNRSLSNEPRRGHEKLNGISIDANEKFKVEVYKKIKGKLIYIRTELMEHPHDPNASAENVISCNCDLEYIAKRK